MSLPLPIRPADCDRHIVGAALELLPKGMASAEARVLLAAIALQESRLAHRCQVVDGGGKGPARGLWQFERGSRTAGGGVWGVYLHRASNEYLRLLCRDRDVNFDPHAIWARLEDDDVLAAGVARLLLWSDARPLPAIGKAQEALAYYLRNWRPGKPRPEHWPGNYQRAVDEVKA